MTDDLQIGISGDDEHEREPVSEPRAASVRLADIPENLRDMAELIGMESLIRLVEAYGGTQVYFCTHQRLMRGLRDRQIREAFDGRNYRPLARKYSLSAERIRWIVSQK